MARSVRKVSRATTKNQKKERKLNKKWLISIVSVVLIIGIGLGVGLGVYYGTKSDDTYVSDKVYFNDVVLDTAGHEVTFNKENYQAISRYIEKGNFENIFIFVYDGDAFYADEKDTDHYDENYVKLITRLADLQYQINLAKEAGVQGLELYIVDVSVDNSTNLDILSDTKYGALYSDDDLDVDPAFIYIKGDQYKAKVEYENEDNVTQSHTISTKQWTDIANSSIFYAINYINYLKTNK